MKKLWGKKAEIDTERLDALSREELQGIIDRQVRLPWRKVDFDLLDACSALLESPEEAKINQEKREASLQKLLQRIDATEEVEAAPRQAGRARGWRLTAAAAIALLILFALPLLRGPAFHGGSSHDGQDYIIMGIQRNGQGGAEALYLREEEDEDYIYLNSLDEIPVHFGYEIALPGWLPEDSEVKEIVALRTATFDTLSIVYSNGEKQIQFTFRYNREPEGMGSYYEQDGQGKMVRLQNGIDIYVASNAQSVWGLYQTDNVSIHIDAIGYEELVLLQIFNSI